MTKWKAACLALALISAPAVASECREDVEQRLDTLAVAFDDQLLGTNIWSWSWGSIYAAVALTQGIFVATLNPSNTSRTDLIIGSVSAAVGSLSFFLLPLRFTVPLKRVRGEWGNPDRCALLARAEAVRTKVEHDQALAKSWVGHVANVVVNVGITLLLGFGYGHWEAGLISGGIGLVVGEINLFTQPTKLGLVAETPPLRLVPIVSRDFNGAAFVFAF